MIGRKRGLTAFCQCIGIFPSPGGCSTLLENFMTEATCDIGLIGLAVMGENLALNIASRGFRIAVYNRTTSVTDAFTAGRGNQEHVVGCHSLEDLVAALKRPRKIMLMVTSSSSLYVVSVVTKSFVGE